MWKKSENNAARIYGDEHLIVNTPCLNHHRWSRGISKLKPDNIKRLEKLLESDRTRLLRRMFSIKGGSCSTKRSDPWYTKFNSTNYYGSVFYGGIDLGYNINKLVLNNNVSRIIVVEEQQEVLTLIKPLLLVSNKIQLYCGDPLKMFPEYPYDFMLWTEFQFWLHDDGPVNVNQNYCKLKYMRNDTY